MEKYEISTSTIALVRLEKNTTQVISEDEEFIVNYNATNLINYSCKFFGSSLIGRLEGTKAMIGVTHKAPIIIEESNELVFFPTHSPLNEKCSWINVNKILIHYKNPKTARTVIKFDNGYSLELDVSYGSINNQILRAARLVNVLRQRKEKKEKFR